MTSIQDVVNAAERIRHSSSEVQQRSVLSADALQKHANLLRAVADGSATGLAGAQQVDLATREVRQSVLELLKLGSVIETFIQDLTK